MHTRQVACSWDGQPTNYGYSLVCHTFRSTTTLLNLDQKPPVLFMYWSSKRSNTPSCFPMFNFSYYMTTKACNRVDSCYNHVQVNIIEISLNWAYRSHFPMYKFKWQMDDYETVFQELKGKFTLWFQIFIRKCCLLWLLCVQVEISLNNLDSFSV